MTPPTRYTSQVLDTGTGTSGTEGGTMGAQAGYSEVRVGQIELDTPSRYARCRHPSARVWLLSMERYMHLVHFDPQDLIDIVAMHIDGTVNSWINATKLLCPEPCCFESIVNLHNVLSAHWCGCMLCGRSTPSAQD